MRRTQFGQTLVIALLVSFVLLVLGAVFISVIARNLLNVRTARERLTADYFAEAGIQYAVDQFVNSEFGADWRPIPDNSNNPSDPDYFWIKPYNPTDKTGGFTRINFPNGRALIRVSYQPSGPLHRQPVIKIESVGRIGLVDPNDPTTLREGASGNRAERAAYIQIGTIDYLRFVMNRNQRGDIMELGAEDIGIGVPYRLILGEIDNNIGGGSIYVNGNLRWSGTVQIGLNPNLGERVYVAGEILHNENVPTRVTLSVAGVGDVPVLPSNQSNFTTVGGLYRDGRPLTAADGYPRTIPFLPPPRMDTVDPATDRPRYVSATRDSGTWRQRPDGSWFNTGQYGYGRGVYINNAQDIQHESRGVLGGYTLRNDWLKPGNSRYWNGPFYEPPGVYIELFEVIENGQIRAQGFRITRNQADPRDVWYNPSTGYPTNIKTLAFRFVNQTDPQDNTLTNEIVESLPPNERSGFHVPFNGVIYAEGNVRVRGRIPSGRQITIVTNGTAYIEGNIVKGDARSALAIIARDYVCVNTTQFLYRTADSPGTAQGDPFNSEAPYFFEVLPDQPMRILFSFGEDPTPYANLLSLYVRHAAGGEASFINLLVNPSILENPFYPFNIPGFPPYLYPLGRTSLQVYPNYEKIAFPLTPLTAFNTQPGIVNMLQFQLQPISNIDSFRFPTDNKPYRLSAVAIQPLDIKIQAALFAQEGSFFVIPGYWFNTNPQDTRENASTRDRRLLGVASPEFPFYGEPLDIQITIEGAIAENFTARLGDQTEWLRKWGWIPREYGNSGVEIPRAHQRYFHDGANRRYAVNLLMRYDPIFRDPRVSNLPLRTAYTANPADPMYAHPGNILPPLPRLPICPSPIFVGEIRP